MKDLEQLILVIGADKFLFGSDYPYRNSEHYIKEINAQLNLNETILKQIIERNIFDELKN